MAIFPGCGAAWSGAERCAADPGSTRVAPGPRVSTAALRAAVRPGNGSISLQKMQQREVEQLRILQEREVAGVGQDQEAGVRDGRGDVFRVLALDRLVVIAVDDEHRRRDRLELRVAPVGLAR